MERSDDAMGWVLLAVIFVAYFLPAIIATMRDHRNATAISVLNVLLGWTGLGWIAALVWSLTESDTDRLLRLVNR